MSKLILIVGVPALLYLGWMAYQMHCCYAHSASIGG